MIKRMRDDQEKSEKRAARAKKQQERRLAAARGEVVADESADVDADEKRPMDTTGALTHTITS